VHGQIAGFDLAGIIFENCVFRDVEFRNCVLSEATQFVRSRFEGTLSFENCESAGGAHLVDCSFSVAAERAWDAEAGRASRKAVTQSVAEDALREVLRKFVGPFGFSPIKEVDRNSGAILRHPCRDLVWEELHRAGIVERHRISGVTGGGMNISEDRDTRHEVRNFLDNAALGPRLAKVLARVLKRM